jgi:uncharacterized protein GlcG (DUF336 family)
MNQQKRIMIVLLSIMALGSHLAYANNGQNDMIPRAANIAKQSATEAGDITLTQARVATRAAILKAQALKTLMSVCIVDAGGHIKSFVRMDDAWLGSVDIAIKKARTARLFNINTGEIGKMSQPGGPFYQLEHTNGGLISFPGGVPIKNKHGKIIGAIGVSGSTNENDQAVAEAGAAAVK